MYTANYQPLRFLYDRKFLFVVRLKVKKSFPLVLSHLLESVLFEILILIRFIGALRLLRDHRFPAIRRNVKKGFLLLRQCYSLQSAFIEIAIAVRS